MQIEFISSIHEVTAEQWNQLCTSDYPFIRHEFFAALEDSGSTCEQSGWQPHHLVLRDNQQVQLVIPLFIKTHSYGEYIFDWSWADAYHRHGLDYYPKLINAIPFTPCYGERWLCASSVQLSTYLPLIITALQQECRRLSASGWHCLFPDEQLNQQLSAQGIYTRVGCQFHWFNRNYASFDDFLATMTSRKRKTINKERRSAQAQGFEFIVKEGAAISTTDWDFFYRVYRHTYAKLSGHNGYLTRAFFHQLGAQLANHTVMICAEREQTPIAAALYLRDSTRLYGRYWGCLAEFEFLHFETCYYQGIDYAIANKLTRFDGGAQGEHKIQRGFEPIATYSNHWLAQPDFYSAVKHFLKEEQQGVAQYMLDAQSHLPFKTS